MNGFAVRLVTFGIVLLLGVSPAFAQDAPDNSPPDQAPAQANNEDTGAQLAGDTGTASSPTPAPADPALVIAQWGPAPTIGPDADRAVAERWFRDQNTSRAHWGVPTATRDPYLDWEAENLMRARLGQPPLAAPQGLTRPTAAVRSSQTDQAVLSEPEFWTVSDDLWLTWLDAGRTQANAFWQANHPDESWYTPERYFRIEEWRHEKFDRYRLMGIAGRVNTGNSAGSDLLTGNKEELEDLAPGSVGAYQPQVFPDNDVAVVAYDPWINPDGSLRQ